MSARRGDGIYKQPSGTYRTSYRDPQGHQVWATFPTKGEAKAWKEANSVAIRRVSMWTRRQAKSPWESYTRSCTSPGSTHQRPSPSIPSCGRG